MRPDRQARAEYVAAFREIANRIARSLKGVSPAVLPIKMYVAGGAALHFHIGERVSKDIDATFSHRIALPDNLEVAYRDADGAARVLYFDRQYNDTFSLMHEDAYDNAMPLKLPCFNAKELEVRLLSPVGLAVSKLARFASQDRDDIAALARAGKLSSKALRKRVEEALGGYVGNTGMLQNAIDMACRMVEDMEQRKAGLRAESKGPAS